MQWPSLLASDEEMVEANDFNKIDQNMNMNAMVARIKT